MATSLHPRDEKQELHAFRQRDFEAPAERSVARRDGYIGGDPDLRNLRGSEPHGPALAGPPRGFLAAGSFPSSNANGRPWLKPDRP